MACVEDILVCGDEPGVGGGGKGAFEAVFRGSLVRESGESEECALKCTFFGYGHVFFVGKGVGVGGGGHRGGGVGDGGEERISFPD